MARRRQRTQRTRRKTIFFPPKNRKLAEVISIESPAAFRESIRKLKRMGIGAREIARIPLPEVTKKAA